MIFKIYPPIGIARVGNSPAKFFVGPETPGSPGTEIQPDGTEIPITRYKESGRLIKRQAARFRIFQFDNADGQGQPAAFPAGTTIRWTVKLANKKDAVIRDTVPQVENPNQPQVPLLPHLQNGRQNRMISASGDAPLPGAPSIVLKGKYLSGTPLEREVLLGELLTDKAGNLLVLGGHGKSESPEGKPIGNETRQNPDGTIDRGGGFYDNLGWHDDVSDGQVLAEITVPGAAPVKAVSAWVVVAPPDFAPGTQGIVTLFDVMRQMAIERQELQLPVRPSFKRDIWPMLRRASDLRWVNSQPHWRKFSTDWTRLSNPAASEKPLRSDNAKLLRQVGDQEKLRNFHLRPWQKTYLQAWEDGNFSNDFDGNLPDVGVLSPDVLTRTVLDGGVAQGFFPGIEAGIIITNTSIYAEPFRIGTTVTPGDLTALMALPWQADFLECATNWWPSQRPDAAHQEDDPVNHTEDWSRPLDESTGHRALVSDFGRLGVIIPQTLGGADVFVEQDRDPNF
jgi:hypothetical protein